jgi:hypothetical protein
MDKVRNAQGNRNKGLSLVLLAGILATGCGALTSSERKSSPSALLLDAQHAFDKSQYTKAISLYEKIIAQDPNNDIARIRLAYAINSDAGLGLLSVMGKLIKGTSTSSTSGAAAGSSAGSTNSLSTFTAAVGFDTAEKADFTTKTGGVTPIDAENFRESSVKLQKLHKSWKTICRLVPKETLDAIAKTDVLKKTLSIQECGGGLANKGDAKFSALFAASMAIMAEAATLYQMVLDADGDGEVDFAKKATDIKTTLDGDSVKIATSGETVETINTKITTLNTKLTELKSLGDQIQGELVSLTIADFGLVVSLISSIPGIPADVSKKINDALTKFSEAQTKIQAYMSSATDTASANSAERTKLTDAAVKASSRLDEAMVKQQTAIDALPADQKEAAQTKFATQKTDACTNFDSLKTTFGLPATVSKPTACATASLTLAGSQGALPLAAETVQAEEVNQVDSVPTDEVPFSLGEALIEYVRYGEDLN